MYVSTVNVYLMESIDKMNGFKNRICGVIKINFRGVIIIKPNIQCTLIEYYDNDIQHLAKNLFSSYQ